MHAFRHDHTPLEIPVVSPFEKIGASVHTFVAISRDSVRGDLWLRCATDTFLFFSQSRYSIFWGAAACIVPAEIMVIDGFFKLAMQAIFQRAKSLMLTIASSYSAASLRFGQYPTVRRINESVTLSSLGRSSCIATLMDHFLHSS